MSEINTETMKKLTEQQLGFAKTCLETGAKQRALIDGAKDYKEVSGQGGLADEYNESLLETSRKALK